MAIKIRNNNDVRGIVFEKGAKSAQLSKIVQYADDTTLLLREEDDLIAALRDIDDFAALSGLKLNKLKSKGMWIGSSKHNDRTPGDITWVKYGDKLKILGIFFNAEEEASNIELNWIVRIENIKRNIKMWQKRNPSLYAKVIISKTFLLSQISYVMQALSLPDDVICHIGTLIFKFLWQKKFSNKKAKEKIRRSVMCKSVEEGGLSMIRVRDQQKVFLLKWLKRLTQDNSSAWNNSHITDFVFDQLGGLDYFLKSTINFRYSKKPTNTSRFWISVIKTWLEIPKKEFASTESKVIDILAQPLFNNKNIRYKGKPLFLQYWLDSGIKYVYQVFDRGRFMVKDAVKHVINRQYAGFDFDFYALLNGFPKSWLQILNQDGNADYNRGAARACERVTDDALQILYSGNRELRLMVLEGEKGQICGKNFWANKLGVDITDRYSLSHTATKESRLRLLHFKILHNVFPTNIILNRMGEKNSELCENCGVPDFVEHMFVHCLRLKGFWDQVFQLIFQLTNTRFIKSDENILLGVKASECGAKVRDVNTANHIILIAKMCVSKMRFWNIKHISLLFDVELELRKKYLTF